MTEFAGRASSTRRVGAMVLRYWYLLRGSWPRMLELAYWPTVQMVIWGLITLFLARESTLIAHTSGLLISAVLLWDILFRGQLGMSISFLEEMWSRNLGHLFVSPLRPGEWVLSLMAMSLIRTLIGVGPAAEHVADPGGGRQRGVRMRAHPLAQVGLDVLQRLLETTAERPRFVGDLPRALLQIDHSGCGIGRHHHTRDNMRPRQ